MTRKTFAWALLVVSTTLLVYWPILGNGFVDWEDPFLYANFHYRGLDWAHLRWMFTTTEPDKYQPLFWLFMAALNQCFGITPLVCHAASLVLHAATAGVFFLLAKTLLEAFVDPASRTSLTAAWTALLFALHPMQAESMACAAYLGNLLPWFLTLCALFAYVKSWRRTAWALALGAALTGWEGVILPLLVLVVGLYPIKRRVQARDILPFALISAGALIAEGLAKAGHAEKASVSAHPVAASFAVLHYLEKIIAPFNLIPAYDLSGTLSPMGWSAASSVAAAGAITAACLLLLRRWPAPAAAWACLVGGTSPTFLFSRGGPIYAHDRYAYLPAMGFYLLAGGGFLSALKIWTSRRRAAAFAAVAAGALALPCLASLTRRQLEVWHDSVSLWRHVVEVDPSSAYANYRLASALAADNRDEEAIIYFRRILVASPEAAKLGLAHACNNLGVSLSAQGKYDEAIERFQEALRWDKDLAVVQRNLGIALALRKRRG